MAGRTACTGLRPPCKISAPQRDFAVRPGRYGQYYDGAAIARCDPYGRSEATTRNRMSLFVRSAVRRLRPVRPDVVDSVPARREPVDDRIHGDVRARLRRRRFRTDLCISPGCATPTGARPAARGQLGPPVALARGLGRGAYPRFDQARDRLRAANSDHPWLWREDWVAGRIPASIGNSARMLCGCAGLCFAASAPVVY